LRPRHSRPKCPVTRSTALSGVSKFVLVPCQLPTRDAPEPPDRTYLSSSTEGPFPTLVCEMVAVIVFQSEATRKAKRQIRWPGMEGVTAFRRDLPGNLPSSSCPSGNRACCSEMSTHRRTEKAYFSPPFEQQEAFPWGCFGLIDGAGAVSWTLSDIGHRHEPNRCNPKTRAHTQVTSAYQNVLSPHKRACWKRCCPRRCHDFGLPP